MVRGPQLRAYKRQSNVTLRRKACDGTQSSFVGLSPVISAARSLRTLRARTLNPHALELVPSPLAIRGPRSVVAPKQVLMVNRDTASSRATGTLRERAGATALRSLICASPPGRRPSSDRQALLGPFGRNAQCCHIIYRNTIF